MERKKQVFAALVVISTIFGMRFVLNHWRKKARLLAAQNKKKAAERKSIEDAQLTTTSERLTREESEIVSLSASELAQRIRDGKLSSKDVLLAFSRQAVRVHRAHNCLTEVFFKEALDKSVEIDLKSSSEAGLLNGVPVSLKDSVGVRGFDNTLGAVCFVDQPSKQDALVVKLLRRAGAIPMVKSNVPQTMLSFECVNPLFGLTTNPWNPKYTPGGSSGGECCLIAGRGSPVGIGTDIGGSLRIPAHFCGVFALKPTDRRFTKAGLRPSVAGQEAVPGICGPMGSSVEDLALILKAVCVPEAWEEDNTLVPLPFDEKEYLNDGKLRIGYFVNDGVSEASPACQRAVREAVAALESAGHTVVEWQPGAREGIKLWFKLIIADGARSLSNTLRDDVLESFVKQNFMTANLPSWLRAFVAFLLRLTGAKKKAELVEDLKESTVEQLWKLHALRAAFRAAYFARWKEAKLDLVLGPVHALPAVECGQAGEIPITASYTMIGNVLDFPCGVVPVTRVQKTDQYPPLNGQKLDAADKDIRARYNPIKGEGLPVGVQLMGLPFQEERVLRGMRLLSSLLPFHDKPQIATP